MLITSPVMEICVIIFICISVFSLPFCHYVRLALFLWRFCHSNVFDIAVLCLREKQGMLVNNECGSWYNRVGNFCCWSGRRGKNYIVVIKTGSVKPTPLHIVSPMAQRTTVVECILFIYLPLLLRIYYMTVVCSSAW